MRVSYRVTSGLVIATYLLLIFSEYLFHPSRPVHDPVAPVKAGAIQFDPCGMWISQMPMTVIIPGLFFSVSMPILLVQGMRNRSVSRWLAVASLISLGPVVNDQLWMVQHCYSTLGVVGFWVCNAAVALMCLHQIVQRPLKNISSTE